MGASATHTEDSTPDARPLPFKAGSVLPIIRASTRGTCEFASQVPTSTLPANITSYGRGAGVGRGLGVGEHLPVHGVGVGLDVAAQYLPPVFKGKPPNPPQTIIWLAVHTAVG